MTKLVFIRVCVSLAWFDLKSNLSFETDCNISCKHHLKLTIHHTYRFSFGILLFLRFRHGFEWSSLLKDNHFIFAFLKFTQVFPTDWWTINQPHGQAQHSTALKKLESNHLHLFSSSYSFTSFAVAQATFLFNSANKETCPFVTC